MPSLLQHGRRLTFFFASACVVYNSVVVFELHLNPFSVLVDVAELRDDAKMMEFANRGSLSPSFPADNMVKDPRGVVNGKNIHRSGVHKAKQLEIL